MKRPSRGFIPMWVLAVAVFLVLGGVAIVVGNRLIVDSYPAGNTNVASLFNMFSTTTANATTTAATSTATSAP